MPGCAWVVLGRGCDAVTIIGTVGVNLLQNTERRSGAVMVCTGTIIVMVPCWHGRSQKALFMPGIGPNAGIVSVPTYR